MQGFIFKNPGETSIITELQKILYIISRDDYTINNPYKEENVHDIIRNNGGIWYKKDLSLNLDEIHWIVDEKHFYWSNNSNNNNDVIIKYYNRFDDNQNISVYKLNNNIWELQEGYIFETSESATPAQQPVDTAKSGSTPLTEQEQRNMNKEKIASIKANQNNLDLLKKEGETIITEIISEKKSEAIIELKNKVSVDNYLETLSEIILEYTSEDQKKTQKQEKLKIAKIRGDGWCQFHSIIHQLLQNKELLTLLINNYEKQDYRNFIKDLLRQNIIKFINKLKDSEDYDNLNPQEKNNLVVDLLNIMITFVKENGDFTIYECNNADGNLGQSINFVEKIWMELFIKDDQNSFTIDKFDYELINDAFFQLYTPKVNAKGDQWGGDSTLILIQFIFNLEINLYTNTILSKPKKNHKLVLGIEECENEVESLIEINLLYTGNNHYDSVIKETQVTPQ
jgi:hypothetical protein